MIYPNSIPKLEAELRRAPDGPITDIARRLIDGAKAFDLQKAQALGVNGQMKGITRDFNAPPEYTSDKILGADYADDVAQPLEAGEEWNAGRRATCTGAAYAFNAAGLPVNPYMETGLNGRGVLGRFGPNHAVDNGALVLWDDKQGIPTLKMIGILRKHDDNAPAFSGGFADYAKTENGAYRFDRDAVVRTQAKEFFEEMISGSIDLLPEYAARLDEMVAEEVTLREKKREGRPLSRYDLHELREQKETALRLEQVEDHDPSFMERLRGLVAQGLECFAGPVLNDNRNTNNAWIESRLTGFVLDSAAWGTLRGEDPVFDYRLVAGDDASGVVLHTFGADFVEKAYASHGAMACFLMASYLLRVQEQRSGLSPDILAQAEEMAAFVNSYVPAAAKDPGPPPPAIGF